MNTPKDFNTGNTHREEKHSQEKMISESALPFEKVFSVAPLASFAAPLGYRLAVRRNRCGNP
jgi:hypothetical protein